MLYGVFSCIQQCVLLKAPLTEDSVWQSASPADVQDKQNHQLNAEQVTVKSHVITSLHSKNASGAQNTMGEAQKKKHRGFMSYGQKIL